MKYLIVLCAVIVMATAEWKARTGEQFDQDEEDCMKSEKLSEENVKLLNEYKIPEDTACLFRCQAVKGDAWDDSTGYNVDRMYEELTNAGYELVKSNLEKCNTEEKNDKEPCKWAENVVKCMYRNKFIKRTENSDK